MTSSDENIDEAIKEYYRLKQEYTTNKICTHCPKGDVFKRISKDDGIHLIAKCVKCSLNIDIKLDLVLSLYDEIEDMKKYTYEVKMQIHKIKNDLMYGYVSKDEAIDIFQDYQEKLEYAKRNEEQLKQVNEINNKTKKEIRELEEQLEEIIKQQKELILIGNYAEAVNNYINQIQPINEEIKKKRAFEIEDYYL